ncbi:MAG: hypothetical protein QOE54_952 [Streptosporangiaceae bacterium]|jgi:hypothetical protein|nr:hypothetical protein [Streptosporangiaceae bacterium]
MAVWIRRELYQLMYSAVASSTPDRVFQGPSLLISSVLYRPIVDSIRALSKSQTVPMEASSPASSRWAVKANEVYCDPGVMDQTPVGLVACAFTAP